MVLSNRLVDQFKRDELKFGLCDKNRNEPTDYSYKRRTIEYYLFKETSANKYTNIHTFYYGSLGNWGIVTHVVAFDSSGMAVGFDPITNGSFNVRLGDHIVFYDGDASIEFI